MLRLSRANRQCRFAAPNQLHRQLGWTRLQPGDPRGYGPSVPVIAGARATGVPNRRLDTHSSTVVDALWTTTTFRTGASGQRVGSEGGAAG